MATFTFGIVLMICSKILIINAAYSFYTETFAIIGSGKQSEIDTSRCKIINIADHPGLIEEACEKYNVQLDPETTPAVSAYKLSYDPKGRTSTTLHLIGVSFDPLPDKEPLLPGRVFYIMHDTEGQFAVLHQE